MEQNVLNNRYYLLARVATGGMAVVYKAQDRLLNRIVAIKLLRPEYARDAAFVASFRQEAQAAANLSHPNVVTIYDVGEDAGRHYIVMEYVEGRDLKSIILEEAPFSVGRALGTAIDICAAVGYAHRAGLVHCDLKPQNVLISTEGRVKVTDFGIARAFSTIVPREVETVWGTPHYFAPEQAAGEPPTPASDVYSLGVILFEMLSGRLPFDAPDHATLVGMHMREQPPPLHKLNPQVSLQLESIVRKVLSKEAASRYRSAEHLGRVLTGYRQGADQATGVMTVGADWTPAGRPPQPGAVGYAPAFTPSRQVSSQSRAYPRQEEPELDWRLWFLTVVAIVAVLGLIPLAVTVYRAYSQSASPAPTPIPTPAITPVSNFTIVPQLVGWSVDDARQEVERAGLILVVVEGPEDLTHPLPTVLQQSPPAGSQAQVGSTVEVLVSKELQARPMPEGLVGSIFDDQIRQQLESLGWTVVISETWSQRPVGEILETKPAAGTVWEIGRPVSLTLSSGSEVPLEVNLNNEIVLESVELKSDRYRPGQTIDVLLRWRSTQPVNESYKVFVHLVGPNGAVWAQHDREPGSDDQIRPTNTWIAGVIVPDIHTLVVPTDVPPGAFQLRVGMYVPAYRLPVVDPGKTTVRDNSILLMGIQIGP